MSVTRWVRLGEEMRAMHLYVPPGRPSVCLEPLSAPPNAFNLAPDFLAPDWIQLPARTTRRYSIELGLDAK